MKLYHSITVCFRMNKCNMVLSIRIVIWKWYNCISVIGSRPLHRIFIGQGGVKPFLRFPSGLCHSLAVRRVLLLRRWGRIEILLRHVFSIFSNGSHYFQLPLCSCLSVESSRQSTRLVRTRRTSSRPSRRATWSKSRGRMAPAKSSTRGTWCLVTSSSFLPQGASSLATQFSSPDQP